MLAHLSAAELGGVAARGASLEVDGRRFNAGELGGIAARLIPGAYLRVCHSEKFSAADLGGIAARRPGQVIFT